ncbi:MAG: lipocalin-like domain-containing protein [Verrucomicrobia bacterium]|nr:lipocalin-like domain-containing protein [Verrucomicrobiota bacterium]
MKTTQVHLQWVVAAMVAVCALDVSSAAQAPVGAAKKLVGTWKLVSIEERDASGKLVVPLDFGAEAVGMLMYDAAGHMAAQAGRRGRPRLETEDVHRAPAEQAKAAFAGYAAYFGTYEVNERESIVIHHVEGSMLPNWEGGDQRRKFTLSGDKLILEPPAFQAKGEKRARRLTWQRVQ